MSSIAPHAASIRLAALEAGDPIPDDAIPPQVNPFLHRAFCELCHGRDGPIAWTALDHYARRYGLTNITAFERFCEAMRAADVAWLKNVRPPLPET